METRGKILLADRAVELYTSLIVFTTRVFLPGLVQLGIKLLEPGRNIVRILYYPRIVVTERRAGDERWVRRSHRGKKNWGRGVTVL